ncbi:MAG: FTR1 family protein [Mariprofundaceae bacterium]|nr:FTR1 family protein [Mariprofundaceae bacterium]
MMSSMIIVFREVLEMSIVLGVLLAATKSSLSSRRWIGLGMSLGLLGAVVVALFMSELESSMNGDGEFIFNAVVLSLAALLIAWTVVWMAKHGREISMRMRQIGKDVSAGDLPGTALFFVTLAAVMREGSEAVFFLFGAAQAGRYDGWDMLWGGIIGVFFGAIVGITLYQGLLRIPVKYLFSVVGWLLMLLAAGMASQAAANLIMVDMLPALTDTLWDTSAWLSMESILGELLHVLLGYDDHPSGMQVLVFAIFLSTVAVVKYRSEYVKQAA